MNDAHAEREKKGKALNPISHIGAFYTFTEMVKAT